MSLVNRTSLVVGVDDAFSRLNRFLWRLSLSLNDSKSFIFMIYQKRRG